MNRHDRKRKLCGLLLFTQYNNNNVIGRVSINVYLSQRNLSLRFSVCCHFYKITCYSFPQKSMFVYREIFPISIIIKNRCLQPDLKKNNVYSPYPSNCLISIPTFNSLVSNVTSSHLQQDLDLWPIAYIYSKQFQRWNISNHKWNEIFSWLLLRRNWGEKNKQGI